MFMRNNRKKNGAPQPEQTASVDAANQKRERVLSTQPPLADQPDDLRFTPNMSSPEQINDQHYEGGVSGMGPFGTTYEDKIPYRGKGGGFAPADQTGDRKLRTPSN